MKPPQLPSLPSVQELLDHPRVKGLVERINRSTLAHRAGNFLDDLRESVAKRTENWDVPSVGQLAERFARRVFGDPAPGAAWINATGVVAGSSALAGPLPDAALQALVQTGGDYGVNEAAARQRAVDAVQSCCPGYSAVIAGSIDAALLLSCSAVATGRRIGVMTHQDVGSDDGGFDWPQLGARAGVVFANVRDGADAGYAAALSAFRSVPGNWPQSCGVRIDLAPLAGMLDPAAIDLPPLASIPERLAAGADLVIADGAGLVAGPPCGIVVGRAENLAPLQAHPLLEVLLASGLTCSLLATTLQEGRRGDAEAACLALPSWQLLSASLDNLSQRANRLVQLIAESTAVAAAEVVQRNGVWGCSGGQSLTAPTVAISLSPADRSAEELAGALRHAPRPVAALVEGDCVLLDLRSVFPRWDQDLVAAIEQAG
ncbi:MAG: hypothetical protein CMJ58_08105 [Planctomycetaceae bacterium]|nr:hypothetical protein [Planctomycetaceae bacterium]